MNAPRPFPGLHRPLLFGHRGASLRAPENTVPSFELALFLGADVLELDVHRTRDGEVVVLHDATVDRTTNGHGPVRDLTLAELEALDAGWHFTAPSGQQPFRGQGLSVPRLEEVLVRFGRAAFNIEIKARDPGLVRQVLDLLDRTGVSRVVLAAEDDVIMRELETVATRVPLGLSRGQVLDVVQRAWLGRSLERYAGRSLQIPPRWRGVPVAARPVLKAAQRAGLEVHLWTVNDPARGERWLRRGLDGIMSDDPGALADVVIREKERRAGRPLGRELAAQRSTR